MTQVTVYEAQQRLPELLAAVEAGETVMIQGDEGQIFQLTSHRSAPLVNPDWPGYPHPGSAKGLIQMSDDFDARLEELSEYME